MTQMLFYEIIILYYKYYSMMWESLVSIKPLVMTSSKILISLFCLSYVIRCIILNVTIHLYQFFFIDVQGSFCFVFLYYITQKLTHWLFTGFWWKESVLCGKSLNERKKFDLFEKDIRHVYVLLPFEKVCSHMKWLSFFAKWCFKVIFNHI